MRTKEGENLFLDLDKRLDRMEEILNQIKEYSAEALAQYREKLEGRHQYQAKDGLHWNTFDMTITVD